MYINGLI